MHSFYAKPLTEEIINRITGISYPSQEQEASPKITYDELAYLRVLYVNFEGETEEGELICNKDISDDLIEIFEKLYKDQYQIEKIRLVDEYNADDERSMGDNNSSCFNYRNIAGTNRLSRHSLGMAVDINPQYNPYITYHNGVENVAPANGQPYTDRDVDFAHKIDEKDLCYKLFIEHGFIWGGAWSHCKDYQHFEKIGEKQIIK